ncbi:hypothetical protein CHS0354_009172 [Potamilus streckersoni]|uniref:DUF885 domain-containing protein n=1 Tax=Potamilus streckersoni TaxID=2493646 RepID=A0AAE0RYZ0_9BIVA|nr:hypothetical protein CHS0354_009172 [Potamilus streckersoni]
MNRKWIFSCTLFVFTCPFPSLTSAELNAVTSEDDKLHQLEETLFHITKREYPEFSTLVGDHQFDDKLESYSRESIDRRVEVYIELLKAVNNLNFKALTRPRRRDADILKSYLQTYINGYKWKDYGALSPMTPLSNMLIQPVWVPAGNYYKMDDYEKYLSRLAAIPGQIRDVTKLMQDAVDRETTLYKKSLAKFSQDSIDDLLAMYSFPIRDVVDFTELTDAQKSDVQNRSHFHLENMRRAYKDLSHFIENVYKPSTRRTEGLYGLKNGTEYYHACLMYHLGYRVTAKEIHRVGLQEVELIHGKMKEVMRELDFDGDLSSFYAYLRSREPNRTADDILNSYKSIITERINPTLPQIFRSVKIPPVRVQGVDKPGLMAYYGYNTFFINVRNPEEQQSHTMLAIAMHETNPGHHFQLNYIANEKIPEYRRKLKKYHLYSVPFREPTYTAYSEGWALYAEYLGEELGLYEDPHERFGRLTMEMFRACRLVVDTGIHAFGMNHSEAVEYMKKYTDISYTHIETEIDRYITWPGQSCAYKMGELKMRALRKKAEEVLGSRFDERDFHHRVLAAGPMPLDFLDDIIDEWLEEYETQSTLNKASSILYKDGVLLLFVFICFYYLL